MADFEQALALARAEEQKISEHLKSLGYRVLPTTDFSARGAPVLEGQDDSLVMPDLQAFKNGKGEWFEAKWKSRCTYSERHERNETGISLRLFAHYCQIERDTKFPVAIVFVHEKEQEVRCGTLNQLSSAFSHDDTSSKMERSGMRFWVFDRIPLWMSLREFWAARAPIPAPTDNTLLPAWLTRKGHAIRKHVDGESFTPYPQNGSPWRWACLACNETWTKELTHHCSPKPYLVGYWTYKLRWCGVSEAETQKILSKPVSRERLVQWFGARWSADHDFKTSVLPHQAIEIPE